MLLNGSATELYWFLLDTYGQKDDSYQVKCNLKFYERSRDRGFNICFSFLQNDVVESRKTLDS